MLIEAKVAVWESELRRVQAQHCGDGDLAERLSCIGLALLADRDEMTREIVSISNRAGASA